MKRLPKVCALICVICLMLASCQGTEQALSATQSASQPHTSPYVSSTQQSVPQIDSPSRVNNSSEISYTLAINRYEIEGYDADALSYELPSEAEEWPAGNLYSAAPRFLGGIFDKNMAEFGAGLKQARTIVNYENVYDKDEPWQVVDTIPVYSEISDASQQAIEAGHFVFNVRGTVWFAQEEPCPKEVNDISWDVDLSNGQLTDEEGTKHAEECGITRDEQVVIAYQLWEIMQDCQSYLLENGLPTVYPA